MTAKRLPVRNLSFDSLIVCIVHDVYLLDSVFNVWLVDVKDLADVAVAAWGEGGYLQRWFALPGPGSPRFGTGAGF